MSVVEFGQTLWALSPAVDGLVSVVSSHVAHSLLSSGWAPGGWVSGGGVSAGLAADPGPSEVDTDGILSFFASKIAPILLAVLGVIFIGRASKGEVSKVLTSSAIALIGLAFIAGAATLFFVGESLIDVVFK
jgi:hypothetical protein